ncbi:GNAT family N-acetyltransferase [Promineifilum sp.]|uniref:GNAT family N-acetyltransferase n=1 Tax=Promineifilum sp. TaxID=2664178 RepID=UPI0035B488AC
MSNLRQLRRAIRFLLREREPADAMAAYYALHHAEERTTLVAAPEERPAGYVALSRTGIDLFRPLVTMRLPTDHAADATEAAARLIRQALGPGQPVILSIPSRYLPLIQALFDIQSEERLRLYALDPARFEPIINVLVTRSLGPGNLPRYIIRSSQSGEEEVVASASLNWQSPAFAEIAVNTRPQHRRQGWGRSVVAAISQELLDSGRAPLYVVAEDNDASIHLAESVGFVDTGVREIMLQATLKER